MVPYPHAGAGQLLWPIPDRDRRWHQAQACMSSGPEALSRHGDARAAIRCRCVPRPHRTCLEVVCGARSSPHTRGWSQARTAARRREVLHALGGERQHTQAHGGPEKGAQCDRHRRTGGEPTTATWGMQHGEGRADCARSVSPPPHALTRCSRQPGVKNAPPPRWGNRVRYVQPVPNRAQKRLDDAPR